MENILITGANGFIGSHLIDFLIEKDYNIYALDRPSANFNNVSYYTDGNLKFSNGEKLNFCGEPILIPSNRKNLFFIECDILNRPLLEKVIEEIQPKFIFHFGAQPYILPSWEDPVYTIRANVIGTLNIFEPIKKYKIKSRIMVACSAAEYGTTATEINRPLKETDPLLAAHPYGISKIAAELLARQYYINFGIEIINLKFFSQTGIRRRNDAPSDFIRKIAKIELGLLKPVIEVGNLSPYRDITGINNTIRGIWLAAEKGRPGETYHICSNKKFQIREILDIALSFSSKKIEVIENISDKIRKTDEDILIGDNSKIKNELGFEIIEPLEKTLEDMYYFFLEYYRKKKGKE